MDADNEVVTTVNQCNLSGEITYGKDWAFHDNVAYLVLDSAEFVCGKVQRSGNWSYIKRGDSRRQEKKTFFDMHIPHGKSPQNASYSYMIVPAVKNVKTAQKKASKDIKVLQNTPDMQSVSICGKIYTVDWSAACVKF